MDQLIKVGDEGTSSPFFARLFLGILEFRDQLFLAGIPLEEQGGLRKRFDQKFKSMFRAASAMRDASREIMNMVITHQDAIQSGRAVRIHPGHFEILETIDTRLNQSVAELLDQSIVATKTGLQSILRDLFGVNIGFMFQQDSKFNAGIKALYTADEIELAQYLEAVRLNWHSALQNIRDQHQHEGWVLKSVTYHRDGPSRIVLNLPQILNLPVDLFARVTANRVSLFIEKMMVLIMYRSCQTRHQYQLPFFIVEIPREQRDPSNVQRFRLAPRGLDFSTPWIISYKEEMDFV